MNDNHDWKNMFPNPDLEPEDPRDWTWIGWIGVGFLLCLAVEAISLWLGGS